MIKKDEFQNLRKRIGGLTDIPAGEQWIGHLQVELQRILLIIEDELNRIRWEGRKK